MDFDYSPFNPVIWGIFIAVWVVIWGMGNSYRRKHRFMDDEPNGE